MANDTDNDKTVFKTSSSSIDQEAVEELAESGGYESIAEYLRGLIRDDAERRNIDLSGRGE